MSQPTLNPGDFTVTKGFTVHRRDPDGSGLTVGFKANKGMEMVSMFVGAVKAGRPTTDIDPIKMLNDEVNLARGWLRVPDELPEPYEDVFVLLKDGTRHVARLNNANIWQKSSYKAERNKYQYGIKQEDILAFMRPAPPPAWLESEIVREDSAPFPPAMKAEIDEEGN